MKLVALDGFFIIEKVEHAKFSLTESVFSVIYESDVVSFVSRLDSLPTDKIPWRCLKIDSCLDFCVSGVLTKILNPLAEAEISVLVNSSFDTDYIYVKEEDFFISVNKLKSEGFSI